MRILRRSAERADTAIAVGSFDVVHRGHAAMLAELRQAAAARGVTPAILTFEPLPREFFTPREAPARLTTLAEKLALVAGLGIDTALVEHFDAAFASLTPQRFAERLARHHRARHVLVGPDFRYGKGRAGDCTSLAAAGRALGFDLQVLAPVVLDGERDPHLRAAAA